MNADKIVSGKDTRGVAQPNKPACVSQISEVKLSIGGQWYQPKGKKKRHVRCWGVGYLTVSAERSYTRKLNAVVPVNSYYVSKYQSPVTIDKPESSWLSFMFLKLGICLIMIIYSCLGKRIKLLALFLWYDYILLVFVVLYCLFLYVSRSPPESRSRNDVMHYVKLYSVFKLCNGYLTAILNEMSPLAYDGSTWPALQHFKSEVQPICNTLGYTCHDDQPHVFRFRDAMEDRQVL